MERLKTTYAFELMNKLSETETEIRLNVLARKLRLASKDAAAEGFGWEALKKRAIDAERRDEHEDAAALEKRALMYSNARGAKLFKVAELARAMYRTAAGDLILDAETIDSGLDRHQLEIIAEVSGSSTWGHPE